MIIAYIFYLYLLLGLLFGLWFVFRGASRVDPNMKEAGWILRLLLLPGTIGLWPILYLKTKNAKRPRADSNQQSDS